MPPRGNEGLDFTPILTHYLFLFTSILSVVRPFLVPDSPQLHLRFRSLGLLPLSPKHLSQLEVRPFPLHFILHPHPSL